MYHFIYKTLCSVTGKYYVGMHSTENLEDKYVGSGKILRLSLRKHGIENHVLEILEFLPDRESLKKREEEIVCEEFLRDENCMNLIPGGTGIQIGAKFSEERKRKIAEGAKKRWAKMTEKQRSSLSQNVKNTWRKRSEAGIPRSSKPHSEATKKKIQNTLLEKYRETDKNHGEKNPNAKLYIFIDPEKNEYLVKGAKLKFCKLHNLNPKKKDQKGWKIKEVK